MSLFDTLKFARLLRLSFYTTSIDKLLQARIVFSRRGYNLGFSRSNREPYEEDYSGDSNLLLKRAINYIEDQAFIRGAYFIEDTSLRIDALSEEDEFPGMRVKEWFESVKFKELDDEIKQKGNNRRAVVKSDIALKLPNLSEPIFFHGETCGLVADLPPQFAPSPMYPWLTPYNFNGWFIPEGQPGSAKRLGEMEFEESIQYDFRVRSLSALLDEYDRLNAAVNVGSAYISTRPTSGKVGRQLELGLAQNPPVLCVIGYKCSGKTTLAHVAQSIRDVIHLEASHFFKHHVESKGIIITSEDDALLFMEATGFDIVARSIVENLENLIGNFVIITGLRTPEEISLIKNLYPSTLVVGITADDRTRFERHSRRGRETLNDSYSKFREIDKVHDQFGLVGIMEEVCDFVIQNDGNLEEYKLKVADLLAKIDRPDFQRPPRKRSELSRSLIALSSTKGSATCSEIAELTDDGHSAIRKYNVNRALKSVPVFAERIDVKGRLLSYKATPRLKAMLDLMPLNPPSSAPG